MLDTEEQKKRSDYKILKCKNGIYYGFSYIKYYENNLAHRLDGPAVVYDRGFDQGYNIWYYHGQRIDCISQEEFEKILKMKAFL